MMTATCATFEVRVLLKFARYKAAKVEQRLQTFATVSVAVANVVLCHPKIAALVIFREWISLFSGGEYANSWTRLDPSAKKEDGRPHTGDKRTSIGQQQIRSLSVA